MYSFQYDCVFCFYGPLLMNFEEELYFEGSYVELEV